MELQAIVHGDRRRGGRQSSQQSQQQNASNPQQPQQQPQSLDDALEAHFASIQALSERQALEDLLPRLRAALAAATDYDPLRERLKAPGLAPPEKRALWAQLAGLAFSRAVGGVWLVPLLDLLVRLKLHVVARHMYLEAQLPGLTARGGGGGGLGGLGGGLGGFGGVGRSGGLSGPLPPRLSDRAKEEFLRCDFFVDVGAAGLLHKLRRAVDAALAAVDFAGAATARDVERLVVAVHARFEAEFARCGDVWAAYLVPPPGSFGVGAGGGAGFGVGSGFGVSGAAPLSPAEAAAVDELHAELREAAAGYRFAEALRAEVRHASRVMGAYVAAKLAPPSAAAAAAGAGASSGGGGSGAGGAAAVAAAAAAAGGGSGRADGGEDGGEPAPAPSTAALLAAADAAPRPFPFVVPIVAKSSNVLFDEATRCTRVRLLGGCCCCFGWLVAFCYCYCYCGDSVGALAVKTRRRHIETTPNTTQRNATQLQRNAYRASRRCRRCRRSARASSPLGSTSRTASTRRRRWAVAAAAAAAAALPSCGDRPGTSSPPCKTGALPPLHRSLSPSCIMLPFSQSIVYE